MAKSKILLTYVITTLPEGKVWWLYQSLCGMLYSKATGISIASSPTQPHCGYVFSCFQCPEQQLCHWSTNDTETFCTGWLVHVSVNTLLWPTSRNSFPTAAKTDATVFSVCRSRQPASPCMPPVPSLDAAVPLGLKLLIPTEVLVEQLFVFISFFAIASDFYNSSLNPWELKWRKIQETDTIVYLRLSLLLTPLCSVPPAPSLRSLLEGGPKHPHLFSDTSNQLHGKI